MGGVEEKAAEIDASSRRKKRTLVAGHRRKGDLEKASQKPHAGK